MLICRMLGLHSLTGLAYLMEVACCRNTESLFFSTQSGIPNHILAKNVCQSHSQSEMIIAVVKHRKLTVLSRKKNWFYVTGFWHFFTTRFLLFFPQSLCFVLCVCLCLCCAASIIVAVLCIYFEEQSVRENKHWGIVYPCVLLCVTGQGDLIPSRFFICIFLL